MALAATTIHEIRTTGDDTNNGGMFDPGQTAGMFTDGAATSATGNSPVFSSASYNFVAGDVGAWVFIGAGTNWIKGWYQIASVASNQATLTASVGTVPLYSAASPYDRINTTAGCASTASPTGATWSIDYSQQAAAQFTYTDLASAGAGLTVSSAAKPFAKQQVGNSLVITGGTNFTAGRYVIASVAAGVATVVGPANITSGVGANGTGGQGGCWATPGAAGAVQVAGNTFAIKAGTYTITSASQNVASGCLAVTNSSSASVGLVYGYNSVRRDFGTRPLLQSDGSITTFTILTVGSNNMVENVSVDGNNRSGSRGITVSAATAYKCKVANCTNNGFHAAAATGVCVLCEGTGCSTGNAFISAACFYCYSHDNTSTGFSSMTICVGCVSDTNTGSTSVHGFAGAFATATYVNCTAYGNAGAGFRANGASSGDPHDVYMNCVSYGNATYGWNFSASSPHIRLIKCAGGNNTSGNFTNEAPQTIESLAVLTADPFTNAASGDFSLNNTAGGGALLRALGLPGASFAGTACSSYLDIGAVQHQDTGGAAGLLAVPDMTGGMQRS